MDDKLRYNGNRHETHKKDRYTDKRHEQWGRYTTADYPRPVVFVMFEGKLPEGD